MKPILNAIKAPFESAWFLLVALFWGAIYYGIFLFLFWFACWGWDAPSIGSLFYKAKENPYLPSAFAWWISCGIYSKSENNSPHAYRFGLLSLAATFLFCKIVCFVLRFFLPDIMDFYMIAICILGIIAFGAGVNSNYENFRATSAIRRGTNEINYDAVKQHTEQVQSLSTRQRTKKIKIIEENPGSVAPPEIRKLWVGLVLPLLSDRDQPEMIDGEEFYSVNARRAMEILEEKDPEAADWYFENVPNNFEPEIWISLPAYTCDPVKETDKSESFESLPVTTDENTL